MPSEANWGDGMFVCCTVPAARTTDGHISEQFSSKFYQIFITSLKSMQRKPYQIWLE